MGKTCPGASFRKPRKSDMKFKKIKLSHLHPAPVSHYLTPEQTQRLRHIYPILKEMLPESKIYSSFEKFELGFCRDLHPDREIAIWEAIAETCQRLKQEGLSGEQQRQVYQLLLLRSLSPDDKAVLKATPKLPRETALRALKLFHKLLAI